MMVVITSWAPVLAFRNPGTAPQIAPPAMPARTINKRWIGPGSPGKEKAAAAAAFPPTVICPSAPMLNRPARNPMATDRPARINGTALTTVSESGPNESATWCRSPLPNARAI